MNWFAKRLAQALFTIWAVITLAFFLIRQIPGGPIDYIRAQLAMAGADPGEIQNLASVYLNYRPDAPLTTQYVNYLSQVLHGNLGKSFWYDRPVAQVLGEALPWTLFVMSLAVLFAFGIGILLGAVMAYKEGSRFDTTMTVTTIFLNSVPYYIAALVLVYVLGYQFSLFPTGGRMSPSMEVGFSVSFLLDILYHATLPVASFVITALGGIAIAMRGNSLSILGADYLRVARLRGLSTRRIATRYVVRNSLLPMYTHLLIGIGLMLGGSVLLERIFTYRGIGFYLFEAIKARDYSLMMGAFVIITISVTVSIFIADLTYGLIDPRASSDRGGNSQTLRDRLRRVRRYLRSLTGSLGDRGTTGAIEDRSAPAESAHRSNGESVFETVAATDQEDVSRLGPLLREFKQMIRTLWSDTRAKLGLLIIGVYVLFGTIGVTLVAPPRIGQGPRLLRPFKSLAHPLGTNSQAQDLFALTIHSIPPMMEMIVAGAFFATALATLVGTLSGYVGGFVDRLLMTISDIMISIPGLPLLIVVGAVLQPKEPWFIGVVLSIPIWAGLARKIRSEVLKLREVPYVEASQIMGVSKRAIIARDILPNLMSFISVNFAYNARTIIFSSVGLYFLGILPSAKVRNWGVMIDIGYTNGALYTSGKAYLVLVPMAAIVFLTLGMVLLAQGMDRMFNPRIRTRHAESEPDSGDPDAESDSTVVADAV